MNTTVIRRAALGALSLAALAPALLAPPTPTAAQADDMVDEFGPCHYCEVPDPYEAEMHDPAYVMDSDVDGLTDGYEWEIGTDANNWDTDGDGVSDWDEVYLHGSSSRDGLCYWFGGDPLDPAVRPIRLC
jgi:hypothetical protein